MHDQGWIYTYPDGFSSSIPLGLQYSIGLPKKFPSCLPFQPGLTVLELSLNTKPEVLVPSASSFTPLKKTFILSLQITISELLLFSPPTLIISIRQLGLLLTSPILACWYPRARPPLHRSASSRHHHRLLPVSYCTSTIFHRKGGITKAGKGFFSFTNFSWLEKFGSVRTSPLSAC
ncbi:hypothetical protein B9Z19DRAFT_469046 [Tuber borchii]|uniref:Uncharacterized protein n=1 Tax=Tuber borchii TaxID=42251 RepID=A0A2T6ZFI4_TUBBO|nr:hypothetical protein B9Z19DRAFT_469046 [Tuber borchii]